MDHLWYLTDAYGPRLTGSPQFKRAAEWAARRLTEYGLENARLEKWGPFGRSWSLGQYSIEMLEPEYAVLTGAPLAWSTNTAGQVTGELLATPLTKTRNIRAAREALRKYMETWKGKLSGKIILLGEERPVKPASRILFRRYTDAELAELAAAPAPVLKRTEKLEDLKFPENPEELNEFFLSLPRPVTEQISKERRRLRAQRNRFLLDEHVLAVIDNDNRSHGGLLFGEASGSYEAGEPLSPPAFVLTEEQYNRIARLAAHRMPVRLRLNLKAQTSDNAVDAFNITAEIPGNNRKDEVVMMGAHFDSWHTGTGATDNGAGSAVMIEVARILKALNLKMDRTVRIALWSGEEQGLLGSKAYVKEHFADPKTMKTTAAHATLSGYFNLDNGSGKIRGVYLQGNDAMRPIFKQWLEPFADQGVSTVTIRNTGGTDHLSFDAAGLPGFQFIQDPLDYGTITHHSDMDVYDHAQSADLMQAAGVIASVVYDAATRPEMLPRKPLPKPEP